MRVYECSYPILLNKHEAKYLNGEDTEITFEKGVQMKLSW